ncbi:ROK family protein [Archangium minus]|uniref:ROK family protein n=1 Tax=Archangium minus TaxID=83450 RepID=A0ABY9X403_9BACT|nr:ROK family protein [Archangium minus]
MPRAAAAPRPSPRKKTPRESSSSASGPRTLAIDIGGSGLKALVLGPDGTPLSERQRVATPKPATTQAVMRTLMKLIKPLGKFERVSVGFPGVVEEGVTKTAHNLHKSWEDFDLAQALSKATGRPTRVLNDAGVQGFGVIEGRGVEMVLTLGTGLGCALYVDGKYVPNIELAHHPFRHGKTYEEYVGDAALKRVGKKKWNKHVQRVLEQVQPIFNPQKIYLGGGNARLVDFPLPKNVKLTENIAGLLGGNALWKDEPLPR